MNAKSAYINSETQEEVYLEQPKKIVQGVNSVCKLQKSTYGLKQAARNGYRKLHDFQVENSLNKSANDPYLLTRKELYALLYVLVWLDDE